jgi:hypothetical protein
VLSVLFYFNVMYAVFLAFARYSMPLYPTLTVLASGGVVSLLKRHAPAAAQIEQRSAG